MQEKNEKTYEICLVTVNPPPPFPPFLLFAYPLFRSYDYSFSPETKKKKPKQFILVPSLLLTHKRKKVYLLFQHFKQYEKQNRTISTPPQKIKKNTETKP